jgi:hypothetical protein
MTLATDFRPFFFPEMGWIPVVGGTVGLWQVATGRMRQQMEAKVNTRAPIRLLVGLTVPLFVGGVIAGIGILVEDEAPFLIGFILFVASGIVASVLISRHRRGPGRPRALTLSHYASCRTIHAG